jgi:hypothetical protein
VDPQDSNRDNPRHVGGTVMELTCPSCLRVLTLRQEHLFHAGLGDVGFLYCDSCPNVLEFSCYNPRYTELVGEKHPWMLSGGEKRMVEGRLRPCKCGGHFRFDLSPRCPHCRESLQSLMPGPMYYVEIGDVVDADIDEGAWLGACPPAAGDR